MLLVLDGRGLAEALPMPAAIDALDAGLRRPLANTPLRSVSETEHGTLLMMPAFDATGLGVKLVTLTPDNPQRGASYLNATYILFDGVTQEPRAVIDGTALTALRTAAMSGLATRHMARPDARTLVLFGAGALAWPHFEAMRAVRPVEEVIVVTRGSARGESLVAAIAATGLAARLGTPDDVARADIVCTCTTSDVPVFDGRLLAGGVHVNAVGAFRPTTREIDGATLSRAGIIVVETFEVMRAECGAALLALEEGSLGGEDAIRDLSGMFAYDRAAVPEREISVFLSSGAAFEDLVVASAAVGNPS